MTSHTNYLYKLNYINAPMLSLYLKEIKQAQTDNKVKSKQIIFFDKYYCSSNYSG